ncbi:hypothetical protein DCAR_0310445 [Daucus carota subsp. sativus]|uniref:Dof zinc finger protein n=1 Tax=Daucus carota subsp. sativus TaxID=79200 RepID=A0A162AG90_DAUCS|nr:PREDICTED: dof zinc finger protein DOF2.4 [Daucus carota subsp. sativus]WOG91197.1 hypothetical protein DCAR_0310445 [Daucus carota subsp. sativus]
MGFSTISAYLDPANWQQQPNNYQTNASLPPSIPAPPPLPQLHGGSGAGSIRPGSMTDRARMANIPMPETAQKCPRCESTNTKFCYFNNYSLTQPRHFCKTCRRYWTRGGALRNVPVGGGCRRNKRSSKTSSGNASKSPSRSETASGSTSSALPPNTSTATSFLGSLTSQFPQLRFMAPMSSTTHLNDQYGEIGMNYSANEMNFPIGSTSNYLFGGGGGGGLASVLSSGGSGVEQWRMQQGGNHHFPNFLGGFDPTVTSQQGLVYQGGGVEVASSGGGGYAAMADKFLNNSMLSQMALVKREGNNANANNNNNNSINRDDDHQTNLARQFLGSAGQVGISDHQQQWNPSGGTPAWTDLSGFSSSSTSNAL